MTKATASLLPAGEKLTWEHHGHRELYARGAEAEGIGRSEAPMVCGVDGEGSEEVVVAKEGIVEGCGSAMDGKGGIRVWCGASW